MNPYLGNSFQLSGVERYILEGGRAQGLHILHAKNGKGLDLYQNLDRGGDILYLSYRGQMVNYVTPNGPVSPFYFDPHGEGWIKSFSAGFLTTCGLENVGSPNRDNGETLGLHGSICQLPSETSSFTEEEKTIALTNEVRDEFIFSRKFLRKRTILLSKEDNSFVIQDSIENRGGEIQPFEYLFHFNIGYPLLDENALLFIASKAIAPRNAHAKAHLKEWNRIGPPTPADQECCYYHTMESPIGKAAIFNPKCGYGVGLLYDTNQLDHFTEWKLLGIRDYVLGLEPGNCTPDGRNINREKGYLKFLNPGEIVHYQVKIQLLENRESYRQFIQGEQPCLSR